MTNANNTRNFKIVLLGEGCVGKTSLVLRYVEDKFNDKHISTLQVFIIFFVYYYFKILRCFLNLERFLNVFRLYKISTVFGYFHDVNLPIYKPQRIL